MTKKVNEPARQALCDAGVAEQHHDELLAAKSVVEQRGVNWAGLLGLLSRAGDMAPAIIELIRKLSGGTSPTTPVT